MASDEDRVLRFISFDKTKEKNLLRASEACKKYELDSEWISANELRNLDLEPQKSVFVLERFEGKEFEFLKEKDCRIVGPQCLLSCLQTETSLPNLQHPVYSVAMRGTVITCTSVPKEERDQLYELIQLMGGVVSKDFTNSVTHLVAGEVGSKKYRVACNVNKAILLPEWVYTCWDLCRDGHISATNEEFMEYKCPIFKGITLCVTGIGADKRKEIKQLVTKHGGTYSGELNMNTCTHLLVDMPKGEKYEFARRWNLHCVSTQWFYDSVQSGFCLDESNFYTLPDEENNSSQAGRRVSFGLIKGDNAAASINSTEKTISNKAAQAAYKSAQKHGDTDLLGSSGNKKSLSNQSKQFDNVSRLGETHLDDGESSEFDVRLQPGNMFLDGCKIFLSGFSGQKLEKLRKIINCGGGTRFNQINEIVSHVVIGDKVDSDLDLLTNCDFQGFVVSVKWILDSAREGKKLAEEDYLCSDVIQQQELSPSCKENEDPTEKLPKKSTKVVATLQKLSDNKEDCKSAMSEEDVFEDEEVFQQYMPQNVDSGASKPVQNLHPSDNSGQLKDQPRPSGDPDATLDEDEEPEHSAGLLSDRYFTVVGFDEHVERLWQIIESNGGNRAGKRQMADYAIFPMNTVPEGSLQAKQLATFCWLEQSLECGHLFEVNDSFLFKPFSIPKGCQPLKGCVLSISQYTGMERDHMYQLAELLGASCQEHFVRKASRNYQASTHLLCQEPNGKKYAAAKKWNLPVVSQEWLFACATSGTLLPIDDYPLGKNNMNVVFKSEAPSLEHPIKNNSSTKETAQNKNMRTSQEEVAIETNSALSAMQPAPSHQVESANAENYVDSGSAQKRPIKRPSIYSRPFRPSFDLADVMEELASPACSSRRSRKSRCSRNSFPLDDFFAENLKQTLQKLGTVAPPTTGSEDGCGDGDPGTTDDEQQGQEKRETPQQGILADSVLSVSKKLSQQQTELSTLASSLGADYRWVYDESCTHLIHQGASNDKTKEYMQARERGIHIVSPHWLYACQEKNERVDENMYPHTFNPKLTLPVLTTGRRMTRSSKAGTTEQEMPPQKKGKSPQVKRSEPNVSENPNKNSNQSAENEQNEEVAMGEQGVPEGTAQEVQHDPQMGAATLESLEAREDFKRQLEAIMDATKGKGRRKSRRNTTSNNSNNVSHNASGNGTSANMSLATRRTSSRLRLRSKASDVECNKSSSRIKSRFMATDESEHSQSDTITYDDPAGRMEREKIMAQLKRGCSPSPDFTTEDDEEERVRNDTTHTNGQTTASKDSITTGVTVSYNNSTVERHIRQLSTTIRSEPPSPVSSSTPAAQPIGLQIKDTMKPPPVNLLDGTTLDQPETFALTPPKFQLSVMTPQEKIDYSALIEQLGGQVFDTVYFNPDCTHVVVGKPNRNEKYLAAVAAGKWVLHKSYLEASREAGFFVDEASHEWGQDVPGEPFNKLAAAAQRWRLRLRQERAAASVTDQGAYSCGAFSGWVVLLCVDKSRQPGFKRLLEAGGAKVSGCRAPFKNTSDFTHAFLDLSKTKVEASDLNLLQKDNVWCLKPDYIAEYLMQEPPPAPQKYLLPELAKLAEPDRPVSSQSRKRKGDDDISGGDKRARV